MTSPAASPAFLAPEDRGCLIQVSTVLLATPKCRILPMILRELPVDLEVTAALARREPAEAPVPQALPVPVA